MDECGYIGCGHEGKIDGLCAKHHILREKALGKTPQPDEPSCAKCGKKASEVKKFIKKRGMCKNCIYYTKKNTTKIKMKTVPFIPKNRKKQKPDAGEKQIQADTINHPPHYTKGKIEVIDFIADQQMGYLDGNIIKYVARYRHKGTSVDDLKKARWYLERLIEETKHRGGANE